MRRTPLVAAPWVAPGSGAEVRLKLENRQLTGSFKLRGAANRLLTMSAPERSRGVVTVSSGNHGKAVATVARRLGIPAVVCLTTRVPVVKLDAIRALGADVVVAGSTQEEADAEARRRGEVDGLTFVHPFDDRAVIAGQGTVGLEIVADWPEVEMVVVPMSGGGLISGIAVALEHAAPAAAVVGVSQERGPALHASLAAGRIVDVVEEDTLADALAGGLGPANRHTLALCARFVDQTALATEEQIAEAMVTAADNGEQVEGGGAVGIAAVRSGAVALRARTAVVVSGGNVDPALVGRLRARCERASGGSA